jgi:hypothetical protein
MNAMECAAFECHAAASIARKHRRQRTPNSTDTKQRYAK